MSEAHIAKPHPTGYVEHSRPWERPRAKMCRGCLNMPWRLDRPCPSCGAKPATEKMPPLAESMRSSLDPGDARW